MSPYEPPGYRNILTPAALSRSDVVVVPNWLSHTASLRPTPVSATVARPRRAFTVTVAPVVAAPASGTPSPTTTPAAAKTARETDAAAGRRGRLIDHPITNRGARPHRG